MADPGVDNESSYWRELIEWHLDNDEPVASGSSANVFRTKDGRFALKVIDDVPSTRRFMIENRFAIAAAKAGIGPTIYASGVVRHENDGSLQYCYIVMDYIEGTLFEDLYPLSPEYIIEAASKLWLLAKQTGYYHIDIHFGNIFLQDEGRRVLIVDYGICGGAGTKKLFSDQKQPTDEKLREYALYIARNLSIEMFGTENGVACDGGGTYLDVWKSDPDLAFAERHRDEIIAALKDWLPTEETKRIFETCAAIV